MCLFPLIRFLMSCPRQVSCTSPCGSTTSSKCCTSIFYKCLLSKRNTPAAGGQACHPGVPNGIDVLRCHHVAASALWMPSIALHLESDLATFVHVLFCPAWAISACLHAVHSIWVMLRCVKKCKVARNYSVTYNWQLHATLSRPQPTLEALGIVCKPQTDARTLRCRIACNLCLALTTTMTL